MSNNRGKRYDGEPKLNMSKVFAVIIAIVVIIMFVFMLKGLLTSDKKNDKITSQSYFVAYKDSKWGVINASGENVIDPSYEEMITVPNSKKGVFVCTYDVNYETGEYKTKVLNEKNQEIFTDYDKVEAVSNKDSNNNYWYEQNVLKVQKYGKYGLINLDGKIILAIEYDEITAVEGIENAYKIKQSDKYGIVDETGKITVEPKYAEIDVLGKDNKSGYIVKDESGKYGIIDYSSNQVLENKYDSISKVYGNDMYFLTENGVKKLVKADGSDVLTSGFDDIKQVLASQDNGVIFTKSDKNGIMNLSGDVIINAEYEELKEAKLGIYIAKKDGKYGIINISNEQKVDFKYNSITYNEKADIYVAEDENYNNDVMNGNLEVKITGILSELNVDKGYIKIRINNEYKYYNLKFEEKQETEIFTNRTLFLSKQDGKYGFVDNNGKVIVDYQYDDATEQNNYGFAGIKKDGKWGSIDTDGNIVQEPTYDLDDYLLVDFIGRWHLSLDVNINSYDQN